MIKGVGLFAVLKGLKNLSNLTSLELSPPKYIQAQSECLIFE